MCDSFGILVVTVELRVAPNVHRIKYKVYIFWPRNMTFRIAIRISKFWFLDDQFNLTHSTTLHAKLLAADSQSLSTPILWGKGAAYIRANTVHTVFRSYRTTFQAFIWEIKDGGGGGGDDLRSKPPTILIEAQAWGGAPPAS